MLRVESDDHFELIVKYAKDPVGRLVTGVNSMLNCPVLLNTLSKPVIADM